MSAQRRDGWPPGRASIGRWPALLGAIAFMFNDVLITHIGNLNLVAAAAWLPLILALFARGLSERRVSWIGGAGGVFAIALLAGHAQMTAITLVGLAAVAVWQIVIAPSWRMRGRVAGLALLLPVIVFGLTALQLLPSLEMTRYSLRAGLSYEEATFIEPLACVYRGQRMAGTRPRSSSTVGRSSKIQRVISWRV